MHAFLFCLTSFTFLQFDCCYFHVKLHLTLFSSFCRLPLVFFPFLLLLLY
uniref:Uncharacterized protein n=1 Tax=Rhizophora mucronata TaxID=61149 RepID=A0A2P2NS92_RHIMU